MERIKKYKDKEYTRLDVPKVAVFDGKYASDLEAIAPMYGFKVSTIPIGGKRYPTADGKHITVRSGSVLVQIDRSR